MRGIMTLLQQKAIMYLSSCYINSLPAVLQWQPQTGRKVAIIGFLAAYADVASSLNFKFCTFPILLPRGLKG